MAESTKKQGRTWLRDGKAVFFAMIAEMDLVVNNLINIFFISHYLGAEGSAAYEVVMPCIMVLGGFSALGYVGVQTVCTRDYGEGDYEAFERHKNAGYTWLIVAMSVLTLLFAAFKTPILDVLGANEGSERFALLSRDCYSVYLLCLMPHGLFCIVSSLLYLEERRRLLAANIILYGCMICGNIFVTVTEPSMTGYMAVNVVRAIAADCYLIVYCFKSNTLHFVWHFSASDLLQCVKFSIVDAVIYLCWAVADYVLIGYVSAHYGDTGLVTLAVVISLIEFGVVMDGVGLAVQPLLGTYLGEKNHVMIRRLMRAAVKAALIEGLIANALVFAFAAQFCGLFGITDGAALIPSIQAVRIVSFGMVFCSAVSLMTSYYMLIDHVALSVGITFLKDGVFYSLLPLLGAILSGQNGMWAAFAIAPLLALAISFLFIRLRYDKTQFPYLLETERDIVVMDDTLAPDTCARLSEHVEEVLLSHGYPRGTATKAALFTEEIGLTILEKNKKKNLLVEISLFLEKDSVFLIERDSGVIFDLTDSDLQISGFNSFILSGLMQAQQEKAYLTTTGYNRNMLRFSGNRANSATGR